MILPVYRFFRVIHLMIKSIQCWVKMDLLWMCSCLDSDWWDLGAMRMALSKVYSSDNRLCSDFSTATSVYFGVESSKLGQAVSGKWGGHGGEVNGTGDWGAMIVATSEV